MKDFDTVRWWLSGIIGPLVSRIEVEPDQITPLDAEPFLVYRTRLYFHSGIEGWSEATILPDDLWAITEEIMRQIDVEKWMQTLPTDPNVLSLQTWMKDRTVNYVDVLYRGDLMEHRGDPKIIELTVYTQNGGYRAVLKLDWEWCEKMLQWAMEVNKRWQAGKSPAHMLKQPRHQRDMR